MELSDYLEINLAQRTVDPSSYHTLPRHCFSYQSLLQLPTPFTERDILRCVGAKKTQIQFHVTPAGLPILLPFYSDGSLATFEFVEINPSVDIREIIYDFRSKKIEPTSLLQWKSVPSGKPLVLWGDFVIGPRKLETMYDESSGKCYIDVEMDKYLSFPRGYCALFQIGYSVAVPSARIFECTMRYFLSDVVIPQSILATQEPDAEFIIERVGLRDVRLTGAVHQFNLHQGKRENIHHVYNDGLYNDITCHNLEKNINPHQGLHNLCRNMMMPTSDTPDLLATLAYLF